MGSSSLTLSFNLQRLIKLKFKSGICLEKLLVKQVYRFWNTCVKLAWLLSRANPNFLADGLAGPLPSVKKKILLQYVGCHSTRSWSAGRWGSCLRVSQMTLRVLLGVTWPIFRTWSTWIQKRTMSLLSRNKWWVLEDGETNIQQSIFLCNYLSTLFNKQIIGLTSNIFLVNLYKF